MRYWVRIRPFVSAGEIFVHGDGKTWETLPLSVFPSGDNTIVRIGRTTYWFREDGAYDGPEAMTKGMEEAEASSLGEALGRCKHNRGRAPGYAYFAEGSRGHDAETSLWPKKPEAQGPVPTDPLKPPMLFARCCDCGWMLPGIDADPQVQGAVRILCPRCGKTWEASSLSSAPRTS